MRYRAIQEHDRRYPIRLMCRALAVSAAGYYAWRTRPDRALSHQGDSSESRKTYGNPSIWEALVKQGHHVGEHRVARLMCQDGIRAKTVEEVAGHHPVESPVARGREHAQSPGHVDTT